MQDALPTDAFDVIHVRHLLIHLTDPLSALKKIYRSTKTGGTVLVEESDLRSWQPDEASPRKLREQFSAGITAILDHYRSRHMEVHLGADLASLLAQAGFKVRNESRHARRVPGGSEEARYQSLSAQQLMQSGQQHSLDIAAVENLVKCLLDPGFSYQSRTTVAVAGTKP